LRSKLLIGAGLMILQCAPACSAGELTESRAVSFLERHWNQEVLPNHPAGMKARFEGTSVLILDDHQRQLHGTMWYEIADEDAGIERRSIQVTFVRSSRGWDVLDYGASLRDRVAVWVAVSLEYEYEPLLEEAERIVGAVRQNSSNTDIEGVVHGLDPQLPSWLTWEPVGGDRYILVRGTPVGALAELECLVSLKGGGEPPEEHSWARGWDQGQACRGGRGVYRGLDSGVERAGSLIAETGMWRGW
jgi:hypothetical protein